ncbi:MAG: MOSC domain-containing protein [Chloroflexota bacterium]|nr:MOSC domain-containing protein [Chloroflexota bacterium]
MVGREKAATADRGDGAVADAGVELRLVSVNVSRPRVIGRLRNGEEVVSGIGKRPVAAEFLWLDRLNLEGDGQADLAVHGGPDKAVYAYPTEHLPKWNGELETGFGPGLFGENLSVAGMLEDEARIGDVWAWGEARLQVTQPRSPCYKLALASGRPDLGKRMVGNGRTGWYLRVLEPGRVPVAGPIRVVERHPAGVTVLRAHRALFDDVASSELEAVAGVDALAEAWRGWALERLDRG